MAHRALIMLAADFAALIASPVGRRLKGRILRLGRPVAERAGVPNRRVMWVHDFPEEWTDGIRVLEFDKDRDGDIDITVPVNLTALPSNWRK